MCPCPFEDVPPLDDELADPTTLTFADEECIDFPPTFTLACGMVYVPGLLPITMNVYVIELLCDVCPLMIWKLLWVDVLGP